MCHCSLLSDPRRGKDVKPDLHGNKLWGLYEEYRVRRRHLRLPHFRSEFVTVQAGVSVCVYTRSR